MRSARGEVGSASVWVLALSGVLALMATAGVLTGVASLARHRAGAAADLGALAAAARVLEGQEAACAAAEAVVVANGAGLRRCVLMGEVAEVTVALRVAVALPGLPAAEQQARAGPVPFPVSVGSGP